MAEHADGSIIVDTEIDPQGFKAGSSELQRAIKSLNKKMEALGPTFQKALSGNAGAISSFNSKASALEDTISQLEAKLESLGNTRVPTEDYRWLTTEIEKAKNQLTKLEEKEIKMSATGVNQNSKAWQTLQYDISLAKRRISEYMAEQESMEANGAAYQLGSATAEYSQLENSLASAKRRLAEMQAQAESAKGSTSKLAAISNTLKSVFSKIGNVGKKAFKGCVNAIKNGVTQLLQFSKASRGCGSAISKLGKKITGFGIMLKRMALRKLMMGILTTVKDGFDNLAQYSTQTNKDLSALKSSLTQLKNSFAAAFAPILTVVTPVLTKLINYLSIALTYIGKLFAALSGAETFTKATAVQEDYADSLSNTKQAAKDVQKQLTGFDDLNVLSDSSSKSDSGAGEASPSDMFEDVPIDSGITDFVGRLKEVFASGDYSGIGAAIGNGINTAVQKVKDFIKWDNVGGTVTNIVKGVADGFNSLVDTVSWMQIGDTFAQGFNTAINTLFLILTEFDWPGLTSGMANNLNGVVSGFNWSNLGVTLSTGMKTVLGTLRSAITVFDWAALGSGMADSINSIDWVGILSNLAVSVSDLLKGALDLLIGFAENLDWSKLGTDLWNGIIGVVENIDWVGIISKAFHLLGNTVGGAVTLVAEFCKQFWESLKSGFETVKTTYFEPYMNDMGELTIKGLFAGIVDMLKDIGNWIVQNIWNPFIEGFKNAFGIHSPSTKMAEMGEFLIEGLLQGIKNTWSNITSFFSDAHASLKQTVSNAWSGIKSSVSSACTAAKNMASVTWSNVKSSVTNSVSRIRSTASSAWSSVKSTVSSVSSSIKSTVSSAWEKARSTVSSKLSSIKSNAASTFTALKNSATTWGKDVCDNMANGISKAKSTVENAVKGVADKIKSFLGFSEPEDGPLSNFHTYMPDMIDLMTYGIKKNQGKAIGAVSDMASAISDEIRNGDYAMGNVEVGKNTTSALTSFSDKVADSFSSLMDRLQAIADGVTFATPVVAKGSVMPYSVAASTDAGTSGITTAIEASNDELASVITQVVTNATTNIVNAIQKYSGTTVSIDKDSVASDVIQEINRRTRMLGSSPLVD